MTLPRDETASDRDRIAARGLILLSLVSATWALALVGTGGFEARLLGVTIRSRGWERPAAAAAILLAAAWTVTLRRTPVRAARLWQRVESPVFATWITALAVTAVLLAGFRYGTYTAGGSDSFGYVSQAHLLARGELTEPIPMRGDFTWRDAELSLIPLAYRPAADRSRMAPIYPPGLPLMMAALLPFGDRALFALVPLFGAAVLYVIALAGRRLGDPLAGGLAAACTAVSATFLLMHFSPMSDVPVTALWLGALTVAASPRAAAPALAGVLAGLAVLTRPNLAPLAVVIVLLATAIHRRWQAAVVASTPVAGCVAALLWVQGRRYGDALASGYGPANEMFALAYVLPNLLSYATRLTAIFTPLIWLWVIAPVLLWRRTHRPLLIGMLLVIAGTWIAYLPYQPFDAWFFTRFLLPAIPLKTLLAMVTLLTGIRRLPTWLRPAIAALLVTVALVSVLREAQRLGVFESAITEQKYARAAAYVHQHVREGGYVIAGQHSGSLRFYAGRPTVRWTAVGADQLDLVVETLRTVSGEVYVVLDEEERAPFETHFAGQTSVSRLTERAQFGQARVYTVE